MEGNNNGEKDNSVLETLSNAICLRGVRPEIRLQHKNGRVRVYETRLSPKKLKVKNDHFNNFEQPRVGWSGLEGLSFRCRGAGGSGPRTISCVFLSPSRLASSPLRL